MILRVNRYYAFLPPSALKECIAKGRLTPIPKGRWVVVAVKEMVLTPVRRDPLLPLALAMKIDRDALLVELMEYLEGRKYATALLTNDALVVHPVAFGKAMLTISNRHFRRKEKAPT